MLRLNEMDGNGNWGVWITLAWLLESGSPVQEPEPVGKEAKAGPKASDWLVLGELSYLADLRCAEPLSPYNVLSIVCSLPVPSPQGQVKVAQPVGNGGGQNGKLQTRREVPTIGTRCIRAQLR